MSTKMFLCHWFVCFFQESDEAYLLKYQNAKNILDTKLVTRAGVLLVSFEIQKVNESFADLWQTDIELDFLTDDRRQRAQLEVDRRT